MPILPARDTQTEGEALALSSTETCKCKARPAGARAAEGPICDQRNKSARL